MQDAAGVAASQQSVNWGHQIYKNGTNIESALLTRTVLAEGYYFTKGGREASQ